MSTILDALKRSEQERKQNKVPTLSDMPAPAERSRWPMMLFVLLVAVLLVVLVWLLLSNKTSEGKEQVVNINNESVEAEVQLGNGNEPASSIKVDVISYAQDASARFVIVNGKLFREQEFVKAGVKIESILEESVVFIERGKRVTRQP